MSDTPEGPFRVARHDGDGITRKFTTLVVGDDLDVLDEPATDHDGRWLPAEYVEGEKTSTDEPEKVLAPAPSPATPAPAPAAAVPPKAEEAKK